MSSFSSEENIEPSGTDDTPTPIKCNIADAKSATQSSLDEGAETRSLFQMLKKVSARWWVAGAIVTVALISVGVGVSGYLANLRTVPDLIGMTQIEAERLILELDLVAEPSQSDVAKRLPEDLNVVVSQMQIPGDTVKNGDVLSFHVEPRARKMPSYVGMTWDEFSEKSKILYLQIDSGVTSPKSLWTISEQSPRANEMTTYGADIFVTFRIPKVEMPDFIGMNFQEVTVNLNQFGLGAKLDTFPGTIVKTQSIAPGTLVDVHTVVEFESGLLVPDIIGKTIHEAQSLLRTAGFTNFPHEGSSTLPITSQTPVAGSIVPPEIDVISVSPKHHKIFRVESNGSSGSVTWGMSSISQETDASLPWEMVFESDQAPNRTINLIAQSMDGTSITCKLIVDGVVVLEQTSTGPYAVVTCSKF